MLTFLKYVNGISGISRKNFNDQNVEGASSLTSLAAKLLEGLEPRCHTYTVIHNYGNPYEKWNVFVARPHLWL